ncbi:hypothetical protein Taro_052070 [Colocasia esculenta]|uniref:Uncharacterized protein n=1 Tax=Colocasia esculenta TaxID=4460 RepID=A0A843XHH4_COLES|nr:hypothetical protein [Colocasia esculenta]
MGKRGLDSDTESFVELSCLGLGRRGVWSPFLAQTRQSLVLLPLSTLVLEPRNGVRREAATCPGCGVVCVVCSVAALSHPYARAEAGARLESRACGLRVPHLAASGGGLVTIVVTAFSSRRFQVFLIARACTVVIAWLCLVSGGVVGLAFSRPMLLVVPASVFSRFRGPVLGFQPVMALACVASRPSGVSGVHGGSACGPSTLCATSLHDSCACCRLQLLLCRMRSECGRSASSCCSGAVGTGLAGSGLPCVEDVCEPVQVRCSWSSSAHLSVCASRRLREPACGVAFTGAGLLPMEPMEVSWSRSWVPTRDGTGVCSIPTYQCVRGPGCAEHCFRFVPDSVGFCGSRVCATTLVGGHGIVLFSSAA